MHRHYIFTDKRESKKGILSAMLGAMSLISVFLTVYFTWQNHGTAYVRYGVVTLLCLIFSAAGLVLDILFKKWLLSPKNREEKDQAISEIWDSCQNETPDAFTLSELETFHRNNFLPGKRANFRSTIYKAVATILLPILGALFTWLILDTPQDTEQLIECFVPKGEKAKQIFLPDGSEVWVNAESILIYPNTFKGDTRTLFLNGEANFKVSRDKKKPFIVKTATLDIEALGTTFNVESYSNSPQTIATL